MKRKYGNHASWKRIIRREYAQTYIDSPIFTGHVTLLKIIEVEEPLVVRYLGKEICIADKDYLWLQHFPANENFSVTTVFHPNGDIVQWYIDICFQIGVDDELSWMDDLYLDIVILPGGDVIHLDEDELEEARSIEAITNEQYQLAWNVFTRINRLIEDDNFPLFRAAYEHKRSLIQNLNKL
ncbi:DUF402 domain-containing protein [Bacillus sp. Marseille-Q1617]|uniref:DUF402 domain-containing protein n=1 Tax=Bacillus sp. Marseille-Q1617 TaxID=2736887 RepID=UPI0020CA505A|nr:DUF402 domain-containing protein [Bacillus sp. Marseille-Q1617]